MKINKEIRQLSRKMLRASVADGQLDPQRIASLVDSLIRRKPRHYIEVLKNYRRLLRLELEKRSARIETASEVDPSIRSEILANLKKKYGNDLTAEFVANPQLLGGTRIRDAMRPRSVESDGAVVDPSFLRKRPHDGIDSGVAATLRLNRHCVDRPFACFVNR